VTWNCVTGFSRQNQRLQKPSAVSVGHTWARSAPRGTPGGLEQMASDLGKRGAGYIAGTRKVDRGSMRPWAKGEPGPGGTDR
jgi:hypothetical protein